MGARYYQPELERWTQQDPSGQEANAYLYVGGNPVNFVDPSGTDYIDFNVTINGPFGLGGTFGISNGEDGSIKPYAGVSFGTPGVTGTVSEVTGEPGAPGTGCLNASAYAGFGGGAGVCTGSGTFTEKGFGTPGASVSAYVYL